MVSIIHLNTLLGIMIMMLLDHYIYFFHKRLAILINLIKDIQLLKNYNKIWEKIEKLMKIDFNTKTTYGDDDKYIKTKIKTYKDSITTNFYNKKGSKKYQKKQYHINVYQ